MNVCFLGPVEARLKPRALNINVVLFESIIVKPLSNGIVMYFEVLLVSIHVFRDVAQGRHYYSADIFYALADLSSVLQGKTNSNTGQDRLLLLSH